MATRSQTEPVLTAEIIPTGIPIASHRMTAPPARTIVVGSRSRMLGSTSVLF